MKPFWSALSAVLSGTCGMLAAEACSMLAFKPLGDIVVIAALAISAQKKFGN
jgi:hypothetical protein